MVKAARSWREKGVDGGIGRVQRKGVEMKNRIEREREKGGLCNTKYWK
jgi:hypothetical protein